MRRKILLRCASGLHQISLGLVGIVVGSAGCKTAPKIPPLPPAPAAQTRVEHFLGTPLSGPQPGTAPAVDPADALAVEAEFLVIDQVPADKLAPLGATARLIAATRGGSAVMATQRLTRGSRFGQGDDAAHFRTALTSGALGSAVVLSDLRGALPRGATVVFEAADTKVHTDALTGRPISRRVQVFVSRDAVGTTPEQLQVGFIVEDFSTDHLSVEREIAADEPDKHPPKAPTTKPVPLPLREWALLDRRPVVQSDELALAVPFKFENSPSRGFVALLRITRGSSDPIHVETCAQAAQDIKLAIARASAEPNASGPATIDWPGFESAVAALDGPSRRAVMVFLAAQTGAELCGDVALVAEEAQLQELAAAIQEKSAAPLAARDRNAFSWALDQATIELLSRQLTSAKAPPELIAVFSYYAGEVARHGDSLDEVLRGVKDRKDLNERIVNENLIFLEDSSPAARVRAYDWLTSNQIAPAGYDPMGPPKSRREAIEKAISTSSTEGSAP
jgi:hypothetical protein